MSVEFHYHHNDAKMGRCAKNVTQAFVYLQKVCFWPFIPLILCILSLWAIIFIRQTWQCVCAPVNWSEILTTLCSVNQNLIIVFLKLRIVSETQILSLLLVWRTWGSWKCHAVCLLACWLCCILLISSGRCCWLPFWKSKTEWSVQLFYVKILLFYLS